MSSFYRPLYLSPDFTRRCVPRNNKDENAGEKERTDGAAGSRGLRGRGRFKNGLGIYKGISENEGGAGLLRSVEIFAKYI